ncbi:MAG TPA: M20/M25/M40 family metallo-hydrolase [Vicinamibacterales bacterium]
MIALAALVVCFQVFVHAQSDPAVAKIIQIGTTDNQVMTWNDYASNRFGGRETGTNAYTDATQWAVWQFKQFGIDAQLEEVGEVPVGFNRGPWFGKMLKPTDKALRFATPSFTAGTKGVQHGGVVILKADPFSIPGRGAAAAGNREKKRAAVQAAIAEVNANRAAFKDKWVLIGGPSNANDQGFARDGRRGTPEYMDSELIPPLTKALVDASALGTIQPANPSTTTPSATMAGQSGLPLKDLDGYVASWDKLPVLPDIKLLDSQYNEIKALVEKSQPVELEFDIRNWFKMGPIKYHNVVATIKGTTYPDEYVVMGGHFDCFAGATGGVDDGNGFAPSMEAIRLIKAAGGQPKRSIVVILFAAEEQGLVGSQAWLKRHPEIAPKVVMMINRDGSPMALTGVRVPETWYKDFQTIAAPLAHAFPKWPFTVEKVLPRAHATSPGGTDSSSFEMQAVPTLSFATQTDYVYSYAWHTTNDLYSELVPYTEQQQESAVVHAVMAYSVANLDKPLTREGVYLADGLYASVEIGAGDQPKQLMFSLDYANAPIQTADFIRIVEGKNPPAGGGRGGGGGGVGGPGGRGGAQVPPIGTVDVKSGLVSGTVVSDIQKTVAIAKLPKTKNVAVKHDAAGVLGMMGPNQFYITLQKNTGLDGRYTALGKVVAGGDGLKDIKKGDPIRFIRITRVGQAARDFKTDDEAFKKLMVPGGNKK